MSATSLTPDVLVLGAGVSGLATAWALASRGLDVCMLERGSVARESTWAGAGVLSLLLPWHYPEAVYALAERGRRLWPDWLARLQDQTGLDAEYLVSGMLVADAGELAAARDWGARHGLRVEAPAPALAHTCALPAGGVWLPEVAQVRNPRLARLLYSAVQAIGVRVLPHTAATRLEVHAGRLTGVETTGGRIACGQVVICAGAWSQGLLGGLALGVDIRPVRGQILLLKGRPGWLPYIVYRAGRYLVPRADGRVLVGSTLEEAGFDKSTTAEVGESLLAFALKTCPGLREAVVERQWAGLRPGSPDNLPTIARHPGVENLYLNAGHFRYGLTMAPAAAELIAALILCDKPALDPAPYAWPGG
ncbi:MAG: glycine oxidase ThiO [Thiobacillaceae bacterium]